MLLEYSRSALEVLTALKSVREADETIWLDRGLIAVVDLFPSSSLAFALCQQNVWARERRRQVRADRAPNVRYGTNLEDVVMAAEAAAAADGSNIVTELHIAKAFSQSAQSLLLLGIAADAMVDITAQREQAPAVVPRPKRARIVGSARTELLESAVSSQDLTRLLAQDERTGSVERKRSILNSEGAALADQEQAAVALINGSPDAPVYLLFGQEDDYTVVGEVNHRGEPLTAPAVRASQRRFDQRLQACIPPIPVKWRDIVHKGKRVWIACMLGRAKGTAVRTTLGSYPYRSGEDTHYASPEQITAWQREPIEEDIAQQLPATPTEASDHADNPITANAGRDQRRALADLHAEILAFRGSPPTIPTAIQGRKLDDWHPVYGPIVTRFRERIEEICAVSIKSSELELEKIGRGLRNEFRLIEPLSGLTWLVEAPRLIARLISDRLLVHAYCTEQWGRLTRLGSPMFDSYIGRVPWVLAPEYRHPETLGHDASVAHQLSLHEIVTNAKGLLADGVLESRIPSAYAGVTLGLALGTIAREAAASPGGARPAWAMLSGVWDELELWEEEPQLIDAFASLAGESSIVFRQALPDRVSTIVQAYTSMGYLIGVSSRAQAIIERIAGSN